MTAPTLISNRFLGLRRHLYKRLFTALGDRGLSTVFGPRFAGLGVIFMWHRVIPADATTLYPGYAVTTTCLDGYLACVRDAGWDIVTLDELYESLKAGRTDRRLACFTFDDGYRDNFTLALPIFRAYRAPMCVYAATGLVDRETFYWWGALERLMLSRDSIMLDLPNDPLGARRLATKTPADKERALGLVDAWCHANPALVQPVIGPLLRAHGIDADEALDADLLTREELARMSRDPLVTIGSHGVSHRPMSRLSDGELEDELTGSRRLLEAITDAPVRHLAYPFGSREACGPREFEMAERTGYVTGVTTRRGNLFPEHRSHLTSLPRREATPDVANARHALYGVSTILRRDPLVVTD